MDEERGDDGGANDGDLEDEFACAGILRGSLASMHSTVERIFMVTFGIGVDDSPHSIPNPNSQIWLKLKGQSTNVKAAKLFVKGVVNQEEQQEVSYPEVLHCIFCGARGLFLDSLIRTTSAQIVVGSPGSLLISGLTEPVVRAYSLIADLVAKYKGTQVRRTETGERGFGESLDSRRAFKTLVEKWEDRHILDLLVLPGSVKEILLDLVKESGLGLNPSQANLNNDVKSKGVSCSWDKPAPAMKTHFDTAGSAERWAEGIDAGFAQGSSFQPVFSPEGTRGTAEGAEEKLPSFPQEIGEEEQLLDQATLGPKMTKGPWEDSEQEQLLSVGNKDFSLHLKFFTAMGYTEEVVKRVLARTGPKEASQILDLVQQEQDRSDQKQKTSRLIHTENRPCETEHREDGKEGELEAFGGYGGMHFGQEKEGATRKTKEIQSRNSMDKKLTGQEEDFVLGVMKKAAASCGYTEQNVAKVYNMLPDGSTHQLLLELQRKKSKEDTHTQEPRESDDMVPEKDRPKFGPAKADPKGTSEVFKPEKKEPDEIEPMKVADIASQIPADLGFLTKCQQKPTSQYASHQKQHRPHQTPHQALPPEIKGPPMPVYSSSLNHPIRNSQTNKQQDQATFWPDVATQSHQIPSNASNPKRPPSHALKQALQVEPVVFDANDSSSSRARARQDFTFSPAVVVTGEQRFLEGLQTPFTLKLTDQPGDPNLRAIVIDGSNVAMSHGLGQFFSCRGIALAIQHFWDRGHRQISALVPQWRQKMDPRIKEQHYLTELQTLGLLSFTPSREVQGKRISSYDDRIILQLAQKTNGVIVTNDNLRDLLDESPVWRDIIKKRLLQYTFVGDLFMVPDDPLGRGGPHLNDFLRIPDPGNHSFAGLANAPSSSKTPRSQTEILNFRDRMPAVPNPPEEEGWGREHGRGRDFEHEQQQHEATGPGANIERTAEETARLRNQLSQIFLGQDNMVTLVLQCHPAETDVNVLSGLILEQQD